MRPHKVGRHTKHSQLQNLNKVTEIAQISISCFDEVLDILGDGSAFCVFDFLSKFTQSKIHLNTIPLTALCDTLTGLYRWLRMPQGTAGTPALFISVMRLSTIGLNNIRMYVDAIGSDDCPRNDVVTLATYLKV